MRIAVTGGTGYVGTHTVRAFLAAGHQVRLLITDSPTDAEIAERLAEHGEVETLRGDVRDEGTVADLLDGADAVWHAAGVVGTDYRRTRLMWEINAYATEQLLRRAVTAGLDPVVSVSSYAALFPPPNGVIGPDTPPAPGRSPYAKTKAYADGVARKLQAEGAPVVVTYPSSVVGRPFLSAPGVTEQGWAPMVRRRVAPRMDGGMQMIDVRDVAEVHARLMVPGRGPKRYICGGELLTFNQMIDALEAGLGQPIRRIPLPQAAFRAVGRIADLVAPVLPLGDGLSYEAAVMLTAATPTDDSQTRAELGIAWRDPVQAIKESFA
ncbi:NAD-dependent epimerase/dehydratase family protein [uncultured Mycolicibacterium sp.]|uniref:NAD-dependent epimerase/dehydratase family protein n=1 Tax=uncultured Mycolicibacterium sp. TaxID=2320817 RepID=UPI002618617B|nr:NAD-dependent epimerase/dehydratase family protein [uncultured Mycolicibacterium sp.]